MNQINLHDIRKLQKVLQQKDVPLKDRYVSYLGKDDRVYYLRHGKIITKSIYDNMPDHIKALFLGETDRD